MNGLKGKKFVFASIAIVCVTITSILLKFDGDTYWKLVGTITGIFTISQAYADVKNGTKQ